MAHFVPCNKTLDASHVDLYFRDIVKLHDIPKMITSNCDSKLVLFGVHFGESLELSSNSALHIIPKQKVKLKLLIEVWETY
jgi:hypothetical protein